MREMKIRKTKNERYIVSIFEENEWESEEYAFTSIWEATLFIQNIYDPPVPRAQEQTDDNPF